MGRDLDCMVDVLMGFHDPLFQAEHRIQFRSRPMRFLGISNHEKGAPRQEISKWSTVCSTFSTSGWSVVSSAPPREVIRKGDRHRTSTKFRLGVIRLVYEIFKRPSYNLLLRTQHTPWSTLRCQDLVLATRDSVCTTGAIVHPALRTHYVVLWAFTSSSGATRMM
jgi:hypothetical protein